MRTEWLLAAFGIGAALLSTPASVVGQDRTGAANPAVTARPWNMSMILYRHKEKNFQLLDYECYGFDFEKLYPYPEIGAPK